MKYTDHQRETLTSLLTSNEIETVQQGLELLLALELSIEELYVFFQFSDDILNIQTLKNSLSSFPMSNRILLWFLESLIDQETEWILNMTQLSLPRLELKVSDIFPNFQKLTKLTSIDFSQNKLSTIPEFIRNLNDLSTLKISNNELTVLPDWICDMSNLTTLEITSNPIKQLPNQIGKLNKLKTFAFSNCEIQSLPESFDVFAA